MDPRDQIADELLVLRSQEGDTVAFGELIDRWQERLWRHAWRMTGDEQAAWDVMQEARVGMGRTLSRLDDAGAFPAWAYRVVGNKCRDWIRRESRRRAGTRAYAEELATARPSAPGRGGRAARLREALAGLPGEDRALLSLFYHDGFRTAEIAGRASVVTDLSYVYHGIMPLESLTFHSGAPILHFQATRSANQAFAYEIHYRLKPGGPR